MSAPSWFLAGLLAGAAATSGIGLLWRTSRAPDRRGRPFLLGAAITAAAAIAAVAGLLLAIDSRPRAAVAPDEPVMTDSPQPMVPSSAGSSAAAMPPASMMSEILAMPRGSRPQSAEPMDQAAADLADRLQRQGGTAADWNLLAQAYDFLGRSDDAQRARARAAQVGAMQRAR